MGLEQTTIVTQNGGETGHPSVPTQTRRDLNQT